MSNPIYAYLKEDVRSSVNSSKIYGRKGDKVEVTYPGNPLSIVSKSESYSVYSSVLSETPVAPDLVPVEDVTPVSKKRKK